MHKCEDSLQSEEKLVETGLMNVPPEKTAGKIKVSLQYDSMRATLMVVIHKVQLQEVPSTRTDDDNYYVTLKILPQNHRSFQTKAVKKCKNLEFKEKFEFRVAYEKLQAQSLKMTLCCFDRFSQHEPLGDHTVHLADLEARGLSLSREILLFRSIQAVQKASGVLGELMISLGYLRLTERLTIVIIRARNLPANENQEDPASYVEVSLIHDGKILKQKKTVIKEPNRNPVFNETLTFHIPIGILHQTSFMLAVKNQMSERTEEELLGKIFLGPASTGSQFDHWNEMRINNKPIARWHKLLD
ncbi:synaptotagmin-6-like [Oculina patagonica]